ncbi:MAG: phosphoribosylamine--glycine ligase [Bacteroidetes bacterium]|nr:phosphoribosylamine--glycine ligase [Bacteroidota bacterium]
MRILIIGGGGREHAIAWCLAKSPQKPTLFVAPGNPGTHELATNITLNAQNSAGVVSFVKDNKIDLVIIGPEQPLVDGLADFLRKNEISVVGPSAMAARLEGSKSFAKAFMARHGIPTAAFKTFRQDESREALRFVREQGAPIVVKASGLAAGKGAIVCLTLSEAELAIEQLMVGQTLGDAASEVVVESFMTGEEVSVFVLTDGLDYVTLAPAQDHKRIGEGDTGPNTGGMGAYAPAPAYTPQIEQEVRRRIIEPTLAGMKGEGHPFQGILYVGLMLTPTGPSVVEFNCRLGDPETQVVLPLMKEDAVDVFRAMAEGGIEKLSLEKVHESSACVVMASAGYPGAYQKGRPITGLDVSSDPSVMVFHAGTIENDIGEIETNGGRVLAVSATSATLKGALDLAYDRVARISFEGSQYRRDIGQKGLGLALDINTSVSSNPAIRQK